MTDDMTDQFMGAAIYAKTLEVIIRPAIPGEVIQTILADGRVETSNIAHEGHLIITNPGGEKYLKSRIKVAAQYTHVSDDIYRANAFCRALPNYTGREITIAAPWGADQHGGKDAMLVARYYLDKPDEVDNERFIIGGHEFRSTYSPYDIQSL